MYRMKHRQRCRDPTDFSNDDDDELVAMAFFASMWNLTLLMDTKEWSRSYSKTERKSPPEDSIPFWTALSIDDRELHFQKPAKANQWQHQRQQQNIYSCI
jgi:hypothetical protein